jgi:hypothetical protein
MCDHCLEFVGFTSSSLVLVLGLAVLYLTSLERKARRTAFKVVVPKSKPAVLSGSVRILMCVPQMIDTQELNDLLRLS